MSTCPNKLACLSVTLISGVNDRNSIGIFMSPKASLLLINTLYCVSNTVLISLLF